MIATTIAAYLSEQHIELSDLSTRTGLELEYLQAAFAGEKNFSIEDYLKICSALDVPYEKFFDRALGRDDTGRSIRPYS